MSGVAPVACAVLRAATLAGPSDRSGSCSSAAAAMRRCSSQLKVVPASSGTTMPMPRALSQCSHFLAQPSASSVSRSAQPLHTSALTAPAVVSLSTKYCLTSKPLADSASKMSFMSCSAGGWTLALHSTQNPPSTCLPAAGVAPPASPLSKIAQHAHAPRTCAADGVATVTSRKVWSIPPRRAASSAPALPGSFAPAAPSPPAAAAAPPACLPRAAGVACLPTVPPPLDAASRLHSSLCFFHAPRWHSLEQ
mmetsp:Transcript_9780/g.40312  ORF Transcript_9780/g.40312 Transcript_9780/m.40312 type:complete len:251 (+) Transcript_9780:370-1122(+)